MDPKIKEVLDKSISLVESSQDPDKTYLEIFGKSGIFTALTAEIKNIEPANRAAFGRGLNSAKSQIEELLKKKKLSTFNSQLSTEFIDITAPGKKQKVGHLHLVSQAIKEIVAIFTKIGFSLQSYPEVDWDWYAFDSLNMPKNHPARDDFETFFVKSEKNPRYGQQVLTPHTSNGQVREMERVKPPIRMLNIARCYRRQIDISHTPMFHQFEGLYIDKNVSIPQLKGTFDFFTTNFFGPKRTTRLRPHHFRFTEPSFEVDVTCGVCQGRGCRLCKSGWLELGGAGMVHPNVLKAGGIDPNKYCGFAFGWGIERTIAMKTELPDIRLFYQNDLRFLEQF
ncbi:phenylalanine--tRNA ligase subunit alpha [Candidatus Curtissbacteria bacterium]|nr:phenylalanine--tRNA ligase subunit alpha [Candidatus Curtissbacteria bacterium]